MTVAALSIQVVIAALTAVAAFAAWRSATAAESSARELRRTHELELRPLVEVYVDVDFPGLFIIVENFGRHPAANVSIRFKEHILNSEQREVATTPLFQHTIPVLPPGKRHRVRIDDVVAFFHSKPQMQWRYCLSYTDPLVGKEYGSDDLSLSTAHLEPVQDLYIDLGKYYRSVGEQP